MSLIRLFKNKIRILEIDYNQLGSTDYISKLYKYHNDGIIIRNLFSNQEINEMILSIGNIKDFDIPHIGVELYPPPCSSEKYKDDFSEYYKNTHVYLKNYNKLFKIDYVKKTINLMSEISLSDVEVAVANKNSFLPGTFRIISNEKAEVGLTQVHIGYQYAKRCINEGSYKDLIKNIDVLKQFSFFTVIQKPISGGDFTLFNFDYKYYNSVTDEIITNCKNKKEKRMYSKNRFRTVNLQPGDAFIFRDYDTWHRVEPICGEIKRITYGFWFGYDKDNNIKIWS